MNHRRGFTVIIIVIITTQVAPSELGPPTAEEAGERAGNHI